MFNFLRKLRMKEMNGKYFKYAIGEIFLVVFGILIALSINNWNEARKAKAQEYFYMTQLLEDAIADSIFYQSRQQALGESVEAYGAFVAAEETNELDTSTFRNDRLFMIYAYESQLIQNHTNAVDLVSDREIQRTLLRYSNKYEFLKKGIEINNRMIEEHWIPFNMKYYRSIGYSDRYDLSENYQKLFQETQFGGIMNTLYNFGRNALNQVDSMVDVNQELIRQLNQKLK